MKKIYLIPQTEVVVIKTESLMQISGNGNDVNFKDATTGSDGEESDSRGFFWDDED